MGIQNQLRAADQEPITRMRMPANPGQGLRILNKLLEIGGKAAVEWMTSVFLCHKARRRHVVRDHNGLLSSIL